MRKIVFDMDGVLANFNEPNAMERFSSEKGFFANLQPLNDNYKVVQELINNGANVYILSASPNKQADRDKRQWLSKYIPNLNKRHIIICRNGDNKANYIKDLKNSVLVDDYSFNLINWLQSGGKCLKYLNGTNGIKNTHKIYGIKELKSFLNLLTLQF